jgi:GntR family transcriptional regulator, trigonelline degradation regulator
LNESQIPKLEPVRDQVVRTLRTAIAEIRLRPGQVLSERELCEATGSGRSSVREAIRRLEAEGLLTTVPGRGTIVTPLSMEEARQIFDARAVLEGLAGRLFATNATKADLAAFRRAVRARERAAAPSADPAERFAAMRACHAAHLQGSHHAVVESLLEALNLRIGYLMALSAERLPARWTESVAELKDMLAAFESRDPDASEAACIRHVMHARDASLSVFPQIEKESRLAL